MSENGLVSTESAWPVRETIDRLAATVTAAGLMVFARIDHAGNAAQAGMSLRPTELLIFGHAQTGADVQSLREITENVSRSAIRSVSPQLFRWREDGWELLQESVGSAPAFPTVQAARPQGERP